MTPKISAFPKCYINDIGPNKRMTLFQWIDMSLELETEGLEIYAPFLDSFEPGYLAKVRDDVKERGLTIPMFCCSPDLTHPDPSVREQQIELQRTWIKAAGQLGCETCRVLSGQRHPEVEQAQGVAWVIAALEDLLVTAEEADVKLAMENHYKDGAWRYPEFAQKRDVFLKIVSAIDSPRFGVQFDPSNALVAGDDPVEFLEQVKHQVISMHASDRYLLPGHSLDELAQSDGNLGYSPILVHGEVGQGLNDYPGIFSILSDVNYQGWISIEDGENGMDEMKRSVQFLKRMRAQHFGEGA